MDNNRLSSKINFTIIDSLRGLAALCVCIAHCRGVLWIGGNIYIKLHPFNTWNIKDWLIMSIMSLTKLSGEAVIFFFVLSGFSIAHSLSYQPKPLLFLYKRFVRLYPPYVLGIVLAIAVVFVFKTNPGLFFNESYDTPLFTMINYSQHLLEPGNIIKALLYNPLHGTFLNPYWSLVYEVIFYVGAIFFVRKLKCYYIASGLLFVASYFVGILFPSFQPNVFYYFFFRYNFYFMIGVFVYFNLDNIASFKLILNKYWKLIAIVFYFLMIGIEASIGERYDLSFLIAALTCVIMMVNMLDKKTLVRPLIAIGSFSYTLYVVHFSIIMLIAYCLFTFLHVTPPLLYSFKYWFPSIFICLGISYLFYLLVEKRTKVYLKKLRGKN